MNKNAFESLLNYREHIEKEITREVGILETALKEAGETYRMLSSKLDETDSLLRAGLETGTSRAECRLHLDYMRKSQKALSEQAERIGQLERDLYQKQAELLAAVKEKKMVEKLKEKRLMKSAYLAARRETAGLDDFSSGAYIRNKETA